MRFQSRKKVLVDQSCLTLFNSVVCPWNSVGKNTGVGCHSLLRGIFPTQGSNLGLLHCRQILYHLSYREALTLSLTLAIAVFSTCILSSFQNVT